MISSGRTPSSREPTQLLLRQQASLAYQSHFLSHSHLSPPLPFLTLSLSKFHTLFFTLSLTPIISPSLHAKAILEYENHKRRWYENSEGLSQYTDVLSEEIDEHTVNLYSNYCDMIEYQ